jgi:hypothetical protein
VLAIVQREVDIIVTYKNELHSYFVRLLTDLIRGFLKFTRDDFMVIVENNKIATNF